jgi:hypothetical protein
MGGLPPTPRGGYGGLSLTIYIYIYIYIYICIYTHARLGSPASQLGTALRSLIGSPKVSFKGPSRASEPRIKGPLWPLSWVQIGVKIGPSQSLQALPFKDLIETFFGSSQGSCSGLLLKLHIIQKKDPLWPYFWGQVGVKTEPSTGSHGGLPRYGSKGWPKKGPKLIPFQGSGRGPMHLLALPRDQKWHLQGPLRVGFSALYRVGPWSY